MFYQQMLLPPSSELRKIQDKEIPQVPVYKDLDMAL